MPKVAKVRRKGKKKKFAGRNDGPARKRYWTEGRLREKKVKALMRHNGMSRAEAVNHWEEMREGRRKD